MVEEVQLTPDALVVLWGILQSLLFEYVPKVAPWYAKLEEVEKRAIQALGVLAVGLLILLGGCLGLYSTISCSSAGIVQVFVVWFTALVANQTTHRLFKKPEKK
jgi:hypothetical protein